MSVEEEGDFIFMTVGWLASSSTAQAGIGFRMDGFRNPAVLIQRRLFMIDSLQQLGSYCCIKDCAYGGFIGKICWTFLLWVHKCQLIFLCVYKHFLHV